MALTAGAYYEVIVTHSTTVDGVADTVLRAGQILLGSKIPATSEPFVIALGSTEAEKAAGRRAAGQPA